jgi:hypothetical protein
MRAKNSILLLIFTLAIYSGVIGKKTSNPDAQYILPPLFEISNPIDYLMKLSSFETIDFQPVRDFSLFFDIAAFRLFGIVTFSTINAVLLGILGCLLMGFLSRTTDNQRNMSFYWALILTSHPLLSQSVGWGMSRKHLLASVLILWATNLFLDWKDGKKSWMLFLLAYVLSVLSQPVTLLWPIWALVHLWVIKSPLTKESKKIFSFLFMTSILLFLINFTYYKIGNPVHADVYPRINNGGLDIGQVLFNFSFDLGQIFYPFRMAFVYYPNLSNALPGIIFFVLVACLLLWKRERYSLSWVGFFLFTLPMSLTLPGVYDQYLILPLLGILMILFHGLKFTSRISKAILVTVALLLGGYSHFQVKKWTDETQINARNFKHSRNCQSAMSYAMAGYGQGVKAPTELLEYIRENSCFDLAVQFPPASRRIFLIIESLMLFYENVAIPYETRVDRLKFLGDRHYFPRLVYTALLATENKTQEVEENCRFILSIVKGPAPIGGTVIENVLRPFCEINKLAACLEVTNIPPQPAYL